MGQSIDGVLLSDFVHPSYFESFRKAGPFDWCGHVKRPLEILPGGYQAIYVPGKGWTQITAAGHPMTYAMLAKRGSRRERRPARPRPLARVNCRDHVTTRRSHREASAAGLQSARPGGMRSSRSTGHLRLGPVSEIETGWDADTWPWTKVSSRRLWYLRSRVEGEGRRGSSGQRVSFVNDEDVSPTSQLSSSGGRDSSPRSSSDSRALDREIVLGDAPRTSYRFSA